MGLMSASGGKNRGTYQYAGGVTTGTDDRGQYVAFTNIPEGTYKNPEKLEGYPQIRALKSDTANAIAALATAKEMASGTVKGDNASGSVAFDAETNGLYVACLTAHASSAGNIWLPSGCKWLWTKAATINRDGDRQRTAAMWIGIFRTEDAGRKTISYQIGSDYGAGVIVVAKITL